jgi:hypothetical protein
MFAAAFASACKLWLSSLLYTPCRNAHALCTVFTDSLGDPAWGAPNFKPMLEATGFKQFHANGAEGVFFTTGCALLFGGTRSTRTYEL